MGANGRPRKVVVVGAGISGLATAYELRRLSTADRPLDVKVLEASGRPGGKVHTLDLDGLPVEAGADSFVVRKPWAVQLCAALGLEDQVVVPGAMGAFVWHRDRLIAFPDRAPFGVPSDVGDLLRWQGLSRGPKLRALLDLVKPRSKVGGDRSMASLLRGRLGEGAARIMVEPLLAGLFAGDPERLSVLATFPELASWERDHGSLLRGARMAQRTLREEAGRQPLFASVWGGLSALVERLVDAIGGGQIVALDRPVAAVRREGGAVRIEPDDGLGDVDALVLATPAFEAARLLGPANAEAAAELRGISYASTAVVVLAYPSGTAEDLPDGTGFVVPRGEAAITACTWISRKWPHPAFRDRAVVRCFVGAAGREDSLGWSDRTIADRAADDVARATSLSTPPSSWRVVRWTRAMPQYEVGHLERLERIERALEKTPGVFVTGAGYRGVGIPDCIRQGSETAMRVLGFLDGSGGSPAGGAEREAMTWRT
jgi:protoporphyrinogen/coproporphyrinogen III oxidase